MPKPEKDGINESHVAEIFFTHRSSTKAATNGNEESSRARSIFWHAPSFVRSKEPVLVDRGVTFCKVAIYSFGSAPSALGSVKNIRNLD